MYDLASLIQMVPIEPWQNSTSFMVQQPSVRQKLTILEDNLKYKNEPKTEDDLKILMTLKVTQNPKYCHPFFYICDTNIDKKF